MFSYGWCQKLPIDPSPRQRKISLQKIDEENLYEIN